MMRQFLQVFKFEFAGFVKGKWYRVSTIVICLITGIMMFLPNFIDLGNNNAKEGISKTTSIIGIYDPTGVLDEDDSLKKVFPKATFVEASSAKNLKSSIKNKDMDIGLSITNHHDYEYIVMDSSLEDSYALIIHNVMDARYQYFMLSELGLDQQQVAKIMSSKATMKTTVLGKDSKSNFIYTGILIFVLYFVLLMYGQMTATNVASEKGNRSMEILVTSTSSNSLIFGKVLAAAAAGILQVAIILGVSIVAYQINVDAWNHMLDFIFDIPSSVLITFAIFGTLGFLFYSFMYGSLGSMVSKVEEVSTAVTPVMLIFVVSFFITFYVVMADPNSLVSIIVSYVPFTSCMAMMTRVALGSVALWEVILSAIILLLTVFASGMLGAKLYRHGTLSYGNGFKLKHILKALKKKES